MIKYIDDKSTLEILRNIFPNVKQINETTYSIDGHFFNRESLGGFIPETGETTWYFVLYPEGNFYGPRIYDMETYQTYIENKKESEIKS